MNPPSHLHLSLLLTIFLIFISHSVSQTTPKLYENVCKDSLEGNERCLKLLEPYSEITSANDYITLSKSILVMAIDKSRKAQDYFKSLVNKYPSSEAIKACATYNYDSSVRSFQKSLDALPDDRESASYDARVAGDGPDHCQSTLVLENKVNLSSITTLNDEIEFLSFVAFLSVERIPKK